MNEKNKEVLKRLKMDMEIGEEISDIKYQLNLMQGALSDIKPISINSQISGSIQLEASDALLREIKNLKLNAQMQQQQAEEELQNSIQQAMNVLNDTSKQLQANSVFTEINRIMDETQNKLS